MCLALLVCGVLRWVCILSLTEILPCQLLWKSVTQSNVQAATVDSSGHQPVSLLLLQ